jgi:membrane protease YdiL (CAAX protease family)
MEKRAKFPYQYFIVTFIWSWLIWLPLVLAGFGILPLGRNLLNTLSLPLSILAAFGPAAGAFYCLRTFNGQGAIRQYLRGLLDLHFGWRAWLLPVLILGGSTWLAWILPELWGAPRLEMLLPSIWIFPPYFLIMVLLGGGQEELGWRGYILDPLEERLGPWLANLVLGVIWATWHLPLFFIPGTSQNYMSFWGFMLLTIGYSWFFAWVRQVSGKRTLAGLMTHGWANAFIPLFPTLVMTSGTAQPRFWIWVSLTFVIGLITMIIRSRKQD